MKKILVIFSLTILLISPSFPQDIGNWDIISINKNPQTIEKLKKMHLDFLMEKDGKIYIVTGISDLLKLNQEGIPYSIETFKFPPFSTNAASIQGGINGSFHSYMETEQELASIEKTYPNIAKVHVIGTSLEDRNISAIKISDHVGSEENEGELLFLGCHHAREWISVEVPLMLAKFLTDNYNTNPDIQALVDNSEIWIVPIVNPDGLEYSIYVYRYWRKNRRDNGDGTYGVDLNRNYAFRWGFDNLGSSPDSISQSFRGQSPFSEPETQAIHELVSKHDFKALVSYHNFSQVILYPWGYKAGPSQIDDLLNNLSQAMSERIQAVHGRIYDYGRASSTLYLTNGDTTDWALGVYTIPSFTIELPPLDTPQGGFFNSEGDIQSIFEENLPASTYLIKWVIQNSGEKPSLNHKNMLPSEIRKK